MTRPRPALDALPLFATDRELGVALMGERAALWKSAVVMMKDFPKVDPLFQGRYVPAVKEYLDARAGLKKSAPIAQHAEGPLWIETRKLRDSCGTSGREARPNLIGAPRKRQGEPATS